MKNNTFYFLASVTLFALASCTNDMQELETERPQALKQIVMTTQDFQPEVGSRTLYGIADGAVTCTWAENDTVGVIPNEGMQTSFPMSTGAGTKNAAFNGGGWALKDGSTYAAYYPFIGDMYLDSNAVPVSYTGQTQAGNASMAHLGVYDYMVASPVAPEFGSANFVFKHLSALVQLKLTVPEPTEITSVKLVAETDAFAVEGKVDITTTAPVITPVTSVKEVVLNLKNVATTEDDQVVTFYMMLPPADLSAQTLKAVIMTDKGVEEMVLESKNFKAGTAYALAGTPEADDVIGDGTYKDGVVSLAEAGTMRKLLGKDYLSITTLKVVGPINSDDVYCLRKMLGGQEFEDINKGKLTALDLSEASIRAGGDYYYADNNYEYYLKDDMMGDQMFSKTNLQQMKLPRNIIGIGAAFQYCKSLKEIEIPGSVTSMKGSFANCSKLSKVTFKGNNLKSIYASTFSACALSDGFVIPESVTTIAGSAFSQNPFTEITIPASVETIGYYAFNECENLKKVTISEGVKEIGNYAFASCKRLDSIEIPNSVTSIGLRAFSSCSGLTYATIGDSVTEIGSYAFYNCEAMTSVIIGDAVETIGSSAFSGCNALESVALGSNIATVGEEAFRYCNAMESVYITDLSAWCQIDFDGVAANPLDNQARLYINGEELKELFIPEDVTELKPYLFPGCESLTKVTVGDHVTSMGELIFTDCHSLTSVTVGEGVTAIYWGTFNGRSLTTITLGSNVKTIGKNAFNWCPNLTSIYCYATTPPTLSSSNDSFQYYGNATVVYVPMRCIPAYKASKWSNHFSTFAEMD